MTMVTFTTTDGKKIEFKSYNEYFKWDAERAKQEKAKREKEKRERKEERERRLARLTEEDKAYIEELEIQKDRIYLSTDFLDEADKANIEEINKQIRKIRGF